MICLEGGLVSYWKNVKFSTISNVCLWNSTCLGEVLLPWSLSHINIHVFHVVDEALRPVIWMLQNYLKGSNHQCGKIIYLFDRCFTYNTLSLWHWPSEREAGKAYGKPAPSTGHSACSQRLLWWKIHLRTAIDFTKLLPGFSLCEMLADVV